MVTAPMKGPSRRHPIRLGLAIALVIHLLPPAVWPADWVCGQPAGSRVAVHRGSRLVAEYTVAEARSAAERSRGLMHCPALDPGTGMLFIYAEARERIFWMKDTPLDLGIIFIASDGRITAIERGRPRSLTRIPSSGPVHYVLEINYDESRQLAVGDRIRHVAPPSGARP